MATFGEWHRKLRNINPHDAYQRVQWYGDRLRVVRFGPNAWRVYHHTPGPLTHVLEVETFAPRAGDGAALAAQYLSEWQGRERVKMLI